MDLDNGVFGRARELHIEMACIKTEMRALDEELTATEELHRREDLKLRLDSLRASWLAAFVAHAAAVRAGGRLLR